MKGFVCSDLCAFVCALLQLFATFSGAHTPRIASEIMMDNAMFAKLVKDCGLLSRAFSASDADVAFTKVKPIGQV